MAKYASIDIGSNTLLLLIADDASGSLRRVVDECDFGRLGQGMANSSRLHPDAVERSMAIVKRYREILNQHEPLRIACVATQAIREAENRDEFVKPAEDLLGTPIEIIAGQREADLVARAVSHSFPELCEKELVVVDVGGGSTEFIHIRNRALVSLKSVPIGAVRLSERYLLTDPPNPDETRELFACIDKELAALDLPKGVPACDECHGFFVVHGHAAEGLANSLCCRKRIRIPARPLRIDVDQAHLNRGKRSFQLPFFVATFRIEHLGFRSPIDQVSFPVVFAAARKAKRLEAHIFHRHVACQNHQVGP